MVGEEVMMLPDVEAIVLDFAAKADELKSVIRQLETSDTLELKQRKAQLEDELTVLRTRLKELQGSTVRRIGPRQPNDLPETFNDNPHDAER